MQIEEKCMGFSIHILHSGNFTFHCVDKVRKSLGMSSRLLEKFGNEVKEKHGKKAGSEVRNLVK